MLINQFLLVNHITRDVRFGENRNALGLETLAYEILDLLCVGVGFDKHKGRVLQFSVACFC